LEHAGGGLASPGAVAYLFERKGVITVPVGTCTFDDVFALGVELGALDVAETLDVYELYTKPADIMRIKSALEAKGMTAETAQLMMHPVTTVELTQEKRAIVVDVLERLEALDDVQEVYSNLA
jgi:transcriptional/translational regulatory protein YebC/TACO1